MREKCVICIMSILLLVFTTGCSEDSTSKVDENKAFFERELELSADRALGAAYAMDRANCGLITGWENKVEEMHAYSITLINDEGKKFFTSFSEDGFIGPIKDENGNMLDCFYD